MYCHIHHCHYHHCNCVPTDSKEKGGALTQEELLAYTQEMKEELKDYTVDLKDQIFSYIDVGLNPVEIANTFASLKEQDTYILRTLTNKIDDLNNTSNLSMYNLRTRVTDLEDQSLVISKKLYDNNIQLSKLEEYSKKNSFFNTVEDLRNYTDYEGGSLATVLQPVYSVYIFDSGDKSEEVSGDINKDVFITPDDDITGSSGVWVKTSNILSSTKFPDVAPENTLLFSEIDNSLYIFNSGYWRDILKKAETALVSHAQDSGAHGLKASEISIGANSLASGFRNIVLGNNVKGSAYSLGRDIDDQSHLGVSLGMELSVTKDESSTSGHQQENTTIGYRHTRVGDSSSITMGSNITTNNNSGSIILGYKNNLSNSSKTVSFGSDNVIKDSKNCFSLGNSNNLQNMNRTTCLGDANYSLNIRDSLVFHPKSTVEFSATNIESSVILSPVPDRGLTVNSKRNIENTSKYAYMSIAIGSNSSIRGSSSSILTGSAAIGYNVHVSHSSTICLGRDLKSEKSNQVLIGSTTSKSDFEVKLLGATVEVSDNMNVAGDLTVTGQKNFRIPHPVPSKTETHYLKHSSYEGDVAGGTIYRYTVTTLDSQATLELPEWFKYINKDVDVYVTPQGHFGSAYGEVVENQLTITSNHDGIYKVLVMGTRNDKAVESWSGAEELR